RERVLVWLGFDAGVFDIGAGTSGNEQSGTRAADTSAAIRWGEASGRHTAIGRSLDQALRRAAARPVSGVVLITDGRSIDEPTLATLRRLKAERIPVFTVPLGSAEPVTDYSIKRAEGPKSAFVNDFVPVEVEIERFGGTGRVGGPPTKVQLIDDATGLVLDEKDVTWESTSPTASPGSSLPNEAVSPTSAAKGDAASSRPARVTLMTKTGEAGSPKWSVKVVPGGGAADLVEENNVSALGVELVDRPLRVAYFDGYPRWEQRYIKNLLVRERSIRGASMLLASGRRFVQEGDDVMTSLPRSPEEWRQYDVVIMGDVRPELYTTEQLEQIKDHVAINGAGLIWVGGEGSTPGAWRGTPLADLLPFVMSGGDDSGLAVWPGPVTITPTPLADRLGVLRLLPTPESGTWWPPELSDAKTGWSQLRWAQRIDTELLKPTAEVLAMARGVSGPGGAVSAGAGDAAPVLVSMRFGAGRVLYLGTDEIWRWRYGRGEVYAERFYLQMIRMLGRESSSRAGKLARLEVTPRRAEVEQPIRVTVELLDQSLMDAAPASLRVRVIREGAVMQAGKSGGRSDRPVGLPNAPPGEGEVGAVDEEAAPVELVLTPEGNAGGSGRGSSLARTYATTWIAAESGRYRVEAADPLLASVGAAGGGGAGVLSTPVEVWLPDDELRRPETDHALLVKLSEATEGSVLSLRDLKDLPKLLPNRKLRLAGEPDVETLWDTPLALILAITLLTLEWVGRRLMKLA
ncbi:MAG: hypothetical protein H7210_03355, partial [Pyrinomonadaceae bacterium]|nr:hypothetical protein [Phycisphaerales bacterium]